MAGFTEFETSDRVLNTRMNTFGNELYSEITKYSTYDLYLKQGNLMNPQKPTGAGTEVLFANVTDVEKLAYTFNYAIPEDLIISKDNRYNLVIPFKQLDANRSFVFRFLYKHEGTTIFDITRNAVTTATGNLTVEFQALNQNVSDVVALANTTVTLQIFVKTLSGTDAQISLLVNDVNALGRLSRNEATTIVSADNVLMPDGTTSVSSAIGQKANSNNAILTGIATLNGKNIATTEKVSFLSIASPTITIVYQNNYKINNVNYIELGIKKTDETDFIAGQQVGVCNFPTLTIQNPINIYFSTWTNLGLVLTGNGGVGTLFITNALYIIPQATCNYIRISGYFLE